VVAAYALALSVKNVTSNIDELFAKAYDTLISTRPTAVNLFYALNELKNTLR